MHSIIVCPAKKEKNMIRSTGAGGKNRPRVREDSASVELKLYRGRYPYKISAVLAHKFAVHPEELNGPLDLDDVKALIRLGEAWGECGGHSTQDTWGELIVNLRQKRASKYESYFGWGNRKT